MKSFKFTQLGTFSIAIMLPILLFFVIMLLNSGFSNNPILGVQIFVIVTFLLAILTFYKITIYVNETHISFRLGIGWFGKKYKLEDIKHCIPVKNNILCGIGIRMLGNGWLYNVSGLKAIELHFHNRKTIVRIGTDRPDEICSVVQSLLNKDNVVYNEVAKPSKPVKPILFTLIILGLVAIALFWISKSDTRITIKKDSFKIKGFYGELITYSDIIYFDTISELPPVSFRANGFSFAGTHIGNYKLKDGTYVKFFIRKGSKPYLYLKTKSTKPIYLNFKDNIKTIDLFNEIKKRCTINEE